LFFAGGDDATPLFFVVEQFFLVIGCVGGDFVGMRKYKLTVIRCLNLPVDY